jgi:hypothetical protein
MNRRLAMSALVLLSLLLTACSTTSTMTDKSKLGTLASSLGILQSRRRVGWARC